MKIILVKISIGNYRLKEDYEDFMFYEDYMKSLRFEDFENFKIYEDFMKTLWFMLNQEIQF